MQKLFVELKKCANDPSSIFDIIGFINEVQRGDSDARSSQFRKTKHYR